LTARALAKLKQLGGGEGEFELALSIGTYGCD